MAVRGRKVREIADALMRKGKMTYADAETAGKFVRKILVKNIR
jgi:hypothetical protein